MFEYLKVSKQIHTVRHYIINLDAHIYQNMQ